MSGFLYRLLFQAGLCVIGSPQIDSRLTTLFWMTLKMVVARRTSQVGSPTTIPIPFGSVRYSHQACPTICCSI
jgi:hypothetical protein